MKGIIVFDVNETLLDVSALAPKFEDTFGDSRALSEWFGQLLITAYVVSMSNAYQDFGACARHALHIVSQRRGHNLSESEVSEIFGGMLSLPPHPEVPESLARLREAGFRLATLTNSAPKALDTQLKNSGLATYFERTLSVDAVRKFKPDPAVYRMAADELGIPIGQMRLVAAHNWDTSGAIRAGSQAAFVARQGMVLGPLDERPDIIGRDMAEVVDQILETDQPL